MSRRDGIDISQIIDQCKKYKDDYNATKKLSSPLEEQIKDYALKHPNEKLVSEKWEAKVTVTPNEDFNEDKAIEILRKNLPQDLFESCVKSKEYIDDDALESLVYNNQFDIKLLASCKTPKAPTVRLNIGKRKD